MTGLVMQKTSITESACCINAFDENLFKDFHDRRNSTGGDMLKLVAFMAIFFVCGQAYAIPYNIGGQTIAALSTGWVGEGLFVDTQGTLPAGANCGDGNRFLIEPGAPMQKEMVSLLLMAMQNKVPATLYVDGCSGGVMKLKSVSISKS